MSDTWDGGYEDSIDDGHEFAEKELLSSSEPFEEEGGRAFTLDDPRSKKDPRSEKLDKGVVPASRSGKCVICKFPIELGDPITGQGVNGWRHAGCLGNQVFETQYKKDEKAANDLLKEKHEEEGRNF